MESKRRKMSKPEVISSQDIRKRPDEVYSKRECPETCGNVTTTSAHCKGSIKASTKTDTFVLEENENDAKLTEEKKVEKYFSDIESSDDSLGYAPEKESKGLISGENKGSTAQHNLLDIKFKPKVVALAKNELDLEPVESEEEYFEDCLPFEDVLTKTQTINNSPIMTTTPGKEAVGEMIDKEVKKKTVSAEVTISQPEENVSDVKSSKVEQVIEREEAINASQVTVGAEEEIDETFVIGSEEETESDETRLHITLSDEEVNETLDEIEPEKNEESAAKEVIKSKQQAEDSSASHSDVAVEGGNQATKETGPAVLEKSSVPVQETTVTDKTTATQGVAEMSEEKEILDSGIETVIKPSACDGEQKKSANEEEGAETKSVHQEVEESGTHEKQGKDNENENCKETIHDPNLSNLEENESTEELHKAIDGTEVPVKDNEPLETTDKDSKEIESGNVNEKSSKVTDTALPKSVNDAKDVNKPVELIEKMQLAEAHEQSEETTQKPEKNDKAQAGTILIAEDTIELGKNENKDKSNVNVDEGLSSHDCESQKKDIDSKKNIAEKEIVSGLLKPEKEKNESNKSKITKTDGVQTTALDAEESVLSSEPESKTESGRQGEEKKVSGKAEKATSDKSQVIACEVEESIVSGEPEGEKEGSHKAEKAKSNDIDTNAREVEESIVSGQPELKQKAGSDASENTTSDEIKTIAFEREESNVSGEPESKTGSERKDEENKESNKAQKVTSDDTPTIAPETEESEVSSEPVSMTVSECKDTESELKDKESESKDSETVHKDTESQHADTVNNENHENESTDKKNIFNTTDKETTLKKAKIIEKDDSAVLIITDDSLQKAKKIPDDEYLAAQSKQLPNVESINENAHKLEFEKPTDNTTEKQSVDSKVSTEIESEKLEDGKNLARPSETAESTDKSNSCVKEDTTMKPAPDNGSGPASTFEEEEPLLMIDTSHKEDNDNEDNEMDTETEKTQTTDSSSDGSLEIFYGKECVNYECKHGSKNFFRATLFALNFYKITKKWTKTQFVCEECYDRALISYEEMCKTLKQKQPLLTGASLKAQEFVEIIDSSDEEEGDCVGEKTKDENTLPKESIEMLEAELEGAIRKVMHNVEIQNQLSWTKQILQQRLTNLEEDTEFVSEQLRLLQKKADHMHNSLYQCPKIKIRQLTPLDLNSGRSYNPETESTIPPLGEVLRASIYVNETYYAVKNKAIASWVPCKVIELVDNYLPHSRNVQHYKIKFLKSKYPMMKTVSAKHMAFFNPPKVRLPIGTRVIAYFDASTLSRGKEKMLIPSAFYPGIIAEPLKQSNKFRYLVFYDDGYFQYVYHKDVRLVCFSSENVWEDVHHQSREFIHNYLTQYAVNRPMVQTQKGQSMLVDYNGKWIYARVIDVDCSLVQMLFEGQSRSEWIYRGSTRLGPVFKESNNMAQKTPWSISRASRRTEPFIRYINGDDSSTSQPAESQQQQQAAAKPGEVRSVAKKSVSRSDPSQFNQQPPVVRHLNNSTIFVDDDNKPKGKVVYYTARKNVPPRNFVPHICSPSCLFTVTHNLSFYSPLAKPLLSGWERQVFRQKSKKFIVYRGPCGKRMRSMEELHRYLRVTDDDLNVDNFDFSPETNCLAEYVIETSIVQKKDISYGKEKMPIPCVNYYDSTMPPDCVYSSERIPTEGVPLNVDSNFLVGCDCEDDCSDKSKCSCWELTYAGAKYGMPNVPNEMVGYQFKRLYEHVPTGIYECNSRCKCKSNCVNRVVQQPLQSKLQVFKTSNRGWGLRCINDVPRGSFICVYAGHLLTEAKANEGGLDAGDEYFAELDYIEVAEQIKEGYESDVVEPDEDEDLYNPDKDEDDDEFIAPESHRNRSFNTRLRARRSTKGSTDVEHDSQERQVISFEPNKTIGQPDTSNSEKPTIRKLFGKDEACYIMDAKVTGNLGRYFNHSCSPNLFVQNVFVDTHDLRFPWVAFFAFTHIRAGTELTWNYNYEVGVVPGKVLYCQCGAPNCRQRLL